MHAPVTPNVHPRSYWAATAGPALHLPRLAADTEAETVIIGGGFTGLSAAYRLASSGRDCLVLEANDVGWGASGRNGGMVVPRYKHTFPALAAKYGPATALDMYRAAHRAVDLIDEIVRVEAIDCGFARCGHLTPVVHAHDSARFEADVRWLAEEAGDSAPRMLDRAETERRIGTPFYAAAYFEPRGGAIHPLRFCQGLAEAVIRKGGRIATGTVARAWRRDGATMVVETSGGRARATNLVLATNAYADTAEAGVALKRRVVPVVSSLIATAPLKPDVAQSILPLKNVVTDAKRLTNYFRLSPEGRMVFGGRGGASSRESMRIYARLAREMAHIFPALRGVPFAYHWSGRVAVTLDGLPRLGQLGDNVHYAMGYNGRGVALATLFGRLMADRILGSNETLGPLTGPFEPIPFHAFQLPGKKIVTTYYRILDALGR